MSKIRIGITQGDINGVGLEVIVKALENKDILDLFTPVVFANPDLLALTADRLGADEFTYAVVEKAEEIVDGYVNVVAVGTGESDHTPGTPSQAGGRAAVEALEKAVGMAAEGGFDLLVTGPIDKHTAQSENFAFPGHTEYLEDKFAVSGGKAMMILACDVLRVALVTTHVPISKVAHLITKDKVERSIRDFNRALKMDFGCERPRIAVLSLNPHCGDHGTIGKEEEKDIIPAIESCRKDGILAFGPISADGFFGSGAYAHYDGVLAMYHDQGLAPFKAIAGGRGVNFTGGLDIIRTSPAHGTAYDLAGKGTADESSLREALYTAIDIARRRDAYLDATENPLEIRPQPQRSQKRGKEKDKEEEELSELKD